MRFTEIKNRTNSTKSFQVSVQLRKRLLNTARPFQSHLEHHHTFQMMKREKALYQDILALFHMLDRFTPKVIQIRHAMLWLNLQRICKTTRKSKLNDHETFIQKPFTMADVHFFLGIPDICPDINSDMHLPMVIQVLSRLLIQKTNKLDH